jgi:hypothetical protein
MRIEDPFVIPIPNPESTALHASPPSRRLQEDGAEC